MAEAVQLLLDPTTDPGDPPRGYIVWSHAQLTAFGGAPPIEDTIRFTNRCIGAQIEDWVTPSGATLFSDARVEPFGGCAWQQDPVLADWPIVRKIYCDPSGLNRGRRMLADGQIQSWGVGVPGLAWTPNPNGENLVRAWAHEWSTGRSIVLRADMSLQSSTGVTGYTGTVKPGRDIGRAIAVREWDATPGFWVADMAGDVYKANGAEDAPPTRHWAGLDRVRDLVVVSDGLGGDPLTLMLLLSTGARWPWTPSQPPTATLVEPAGTITDTTRPQIRWAYSDPNGDAQSSFHVVLVTEAVGDLIGFDPVTTDDDIETWYGNGRTAFAVTPSRDLSNGDYTAFVRVRDTAGDLSAWDDIDFTVHVTAPAAPTIDATPAGDWTVTLDIAGIDLDGTIDVEFTDDPPEDVVRTWLPVRDSGGTSDLDGEATLTDREPRFNRRRWYRAAVRVDDIASEWSEEDSAYVTEDARWVLSAPLELTDPVVVEVTGLRWIEPIPAGVHRTAGRADAIVTRPASGRQSAETSPTLRTLDADAHEALRNLLDGTRTLLLRSPYGQHWFVEATGELSTEMLDALAPLEDETTEMRHAHEQSVTFVEVARP